MDFSAFTTERIQAYAEEAKAAWGHTPQYKAFEGGGCQNEVKVTGVL